MKYIISVLLLLISVNNYAFDDSSVIEESDFHQLGQKMKQENLGLVLMFHAEFCSFCQQMDEEILSPMVISGEYDKRIFVRKLQIDEGVGIKDFAGNTVQPWDISSKYGAGLTPTLVFLNYEGKQMAKQIVGINTIELFNAYLDAEIDTMMSKLRETSPKKETTQIN